MKYRTLGNTSVNVSAIGLGCMGMNHAYGEPNDEESIATLEKAIEIGVKLLGYSRCVRQREKMKN